MVLGCTDLIKGGTWAEKFENHCFKIQLYFGVFKGMQVLVSEVNCCLIHIDWSWQHTDEV